MIQKIFEAPENISTRDRRYPSIFLAGSIEMGIARNWQLEIIAHLEGIKNRLNVFNPRRKDWDSSWSQDIHNSQFYHQVSWELEALDQADFIIMFLDKNTKSPISLLELGLYAKSGKLLVYCEDGYWRKGNVDIVCQKYNVPTFNNFNSIINYLDPPEFYS
jgi:hypothetical protein